jgi:hypothetical protein
MELLSSPFALTITACNMPIHSDKLYSILRLHNNSENNFKNINRRATGTVNIHKSITSIYRLYFTRTFDIAPLKIYITTLFRTRTFKDHCQVPWCQVPLENVSPFPNSFDIPGKKGIFSECQLHTICNLFRWMFESNAIWYNTTQHKTTHNNKQQYNNNTTQ